MFDVKSAFDVVCKEILMRRVYNFGVPQKTWSLIDDLHTNSYSAVKWRGAMSDLFEITQGVKQGLI